MLSASSTKPKRVYSVEAHAKRLANRRVYRAKNREKERAANKVWKQNNPEKRREYIRAATIKKRYGLTRDQYQEMFEAQDHRCDICGVEQEKLTRKLCVDHDHQTKAVRSLLCHHCNVVLGNARDRIDILRSAISYLERHRT